MAVETLKSAGVTNSDASPVVANTAGKGAPGRVRHVQGFVTVPAAASIASKFTFARVPSDAVVKQVILESEAQAVGAGDVGLYYSTGKDGTQPSLAGTVIDADFFGSAVSVAAASRADITAESGVYTLNKRDQPLWQAAGLTADPGGWFDIAMTLTTAVTAGTGRTGAEVFYVGG